MQPVGSLRVPAPSEPFPFALNQVHVGDCLDLLRQLPDGCIQCCVTSPPYWGLRDYGVDGQVGLEKTIDEFICKMVEIFREVRRVLRDDGTLWLNMGDCYCATPTGKIGDKTTFEGGRANQEASYKAKKTKKDFKGLKHKDMVGQPWRLAFALQGFAVVPYHSFSRWADILKTARVEEDWDLVGLCEGLLRDQDLLTRLQYEAQWLRSDIIWYKKNPMPESVTDRPTKAHEYLFLLTKSAKYYYDNDAIRGKHATPENQRNNKHGKQALRGQEAIRPRGNLEHVDNMAERYYSKGGRNKRTVWTIATAPYKGAHFATFPPALVEPCILAGTSEKGACKKCGAPWERIITKTKSFESGSGKSGKRPSGKNGPDCQGGGDTGDIRMGPVIHTKTTGWHPTCSHYDELYIDENPRTKNKRKLRHQDMADRWFMRVCARPGNLNWSRTRCIVLDPFAGSGTTGMVAIKHGRDFIGFELNQEYAETLANPRLASTVTIKKATDKGVTVQELKQNQGTLFN